jgi:REP element-mobilizing transposase RayT
MIAYYFDRMSRPLRIQYPNAHYHIHARGNERRRIFWEDVERERFCELLGDMCQKFEIILYAFTLMTNHFHLMLSTPLANLSLAIHWLKTSYAIWLNRRRERVGHLFQGRFRSLLIENKGYFLELNRYIHINSVRARMVKMPEQYPWSSYIDYLRKEPRWQWLDRDTVLSELGGTDDHRIERYRDFIHAGIQLPNSAYDKFREGSILGSHEFCEQFTKKMKVDVKKGKPIVKDAIDLINRLLLKMAPHFLGHRSTLIYLLYDLGYLHREIGVHFGISPSAVSHSHRKYVPPVSERHIMDQILSVVHSSLLGSDLGYEHNSHPEV